MEAHWLVCIILSSSVLCSAEAALTKKPGSVAKRQFQAGDILGQHGLCTPPTVLVHGTVTLNGGLSVGDTASISCLSGYRLDGVDQITCQGAADNGGWSDPMPRCVHECGETFTAPRGKLYSPGHPGNYPGDTTCTYTVSSPPGTGIHIQVVSFSTEDGYDILRVYNGADTSSGAVRSYSGGLPADTDARQYYSISTQLYLRFTSDSSTSDSGFIIDYEHYDLSTRECDDPGTLAHGTQIVTGMHEGDFIFYTCDPGYELHGPQAIMCLPGDNRVWNDAPPTCVASAPCDDPGTPSHASSVATGFSAGDTVTYTCDPGYTMHGTATITCLTGDNRVWSDAPPTCIASTPCDDPGTPSHSSRVVEGFGPGDKITYTCNPGYTMHGTATITCLTGDNRVWSAAPPTCRAECGADWTTPTGAVLSPNYPSTYGYNRNCIYTISVQPGQGIILTVRDFVTESSDDYLQIRDGSHSTATYIGQYSGTQLHTGDVIESTSYQLWLKFWADSTSTYTGFHIDYEAFDITLRDCDDPGTPRYSSRVVTGLSAGDTITYTCNPGYTMHGTATITCLTGNSRVWSASPPTCTAECGSDWTAPTGAILSPNYPSTYGYNRNCIYTISVQPGQGIRLTVRDFVTESSDDYLQIRDGSHSTATYIGQYSGTQLHTGDVIESTSYQLWLKFWADSTSTYTGFHIDYEAFDITLRDCDDPGTPSYSSRVVTGLSAGDTITYTCDPGYTMHGTATITCLTGNSRVWSAAPPTCTAECGSDWTAPTGAILSPNYPSTYGYNRNCIYTISVQPGQGIRLTVRDFVTESSDDYLQIRDGSHSTATYIGQYSGTQLHTGDVIESTSYQLWLKFWADSTSTYTGFHIDYEAFDITLRDCDDPGTPSYSSRVVTGLSAGDTITYTCNPGYTMHGTATITCLTGNSRVWSAAPPTCTAECGGDWTAPTGAILSPNYPSTYGYNRNCIYTISVQPGQGIRLTVRDFVTESSGDDYLQIRDGSHSAATLIGQYSGSQLHAGDVIESTSYQLWLKFWADTSSAYTGFHIDYEAFDITLKDCDDPGTPSYSSRVVTGLSAGDTITYTCNPGYTMHGTATITCLTGNSRVWSDPNPTCVAECGADWTAPTGAILSPNYPGTYGYNRNCIYTISVQPGQGIRLTVRDFRTEASDDYLQIRDGMDSTSTLIGQYSGSQLSNGQVLESTSHHLWFKFWADSSSAYSGFHIDYAAFDITLRDCDDPGTPRYSSRVVTGLSAGDTITYTCNPGYTMHGTATITCLTGNNRVWSAAPPTCTADCGADWTGPSGAVLSPNYPSNYGYNQNCYYTVTVSAGEYIQLTVRSFRTEASDDYLEVRNGLDSSGTLIGRYSGSVLSAGDILKSTSYQLYFKFHSDSSSNYQGFHIDYQAVDIGVRQCDDPGTPPYASRPLAAAFSAGDSVTYTCDPGYTMHGTATITCLTGDDRVWSDAPPTCVAECGGDYRYVTSGAVLSPNYPSSYGYNKNCYYTITQDLGSGIRLTVRDFYLENGGDYLEIRDGPDDSADLIGRYDGTDLSAGDVIESTGYTLWLKFRADSSYGYTGFHIDFERFDLTYRECDDPGTPSYSSRVVEGFGPGDKITYTCDPGYTMHGTATITCLTGVNRVWSSAPPSCVAECGSDWTAPTGAVLSPNYPRSYPNNQNCYYTITVNPGSFIQLTVRAFYTGSSASDYLEIRDGGTESATRIGRYSGSQLSTGDIIKSTSYQLWFKFHSDSSSGYSGYRIDYTEMDISLRDCDDPGTPSYSSRVVTGLSAGDTITYTCNPGYTMHGTATTTCLTGNSRVWSDPNPTCIAECGSDWTAPTGAVLSPNYPRSYSNNQNCYYTITVNPGSFIQLTVRAFYTGSSSGDYLEIRDGGTATDTYIGRYSGSGLSNGDVIKSTSYQLWFKFRSDSSYTYSGFHIDYTEMDLSLRDCDDPGTPTYSSRVVEGFGPGDKITYTCNPGYTMHGTATTTCLTGNSRVWSDPNPTCVAECGSDWTAPTGAVLSPNYPNSYSNNQNCYYTITVSPGSFIQLTVRAFYTGSSSGDYLEIRDGGTETDTRIGRYSGSALSNGDVIKSTSYQLWFKFRSDSSSTYSGYHIDYAEMDISLRDCDDPGTPTYSSRVVEGFGPGDKITYTCNPGYTMHGTATTTCLTGNSRVWSDPNPTCVAECGSDWTAPTGAVLSPNYPNSYSNNQNCYYTITVSPGSFIQLTVRAFYTEGGSDYLEIRDGGTATDTYIGRYSGSGLSNRDVIKSTSYKLWFKFRSDSTYTYSGFHIDYAAVDISLRSCDDPGTPPNSNRAVTTFDAGNSVTYTCNPGYTMHGTATITCLTGDSRVWSEDPPSCVAECGGDWRDPTGAILSPNYPSSYNPSQTCYYTITVDPGKTIRLTVRAFFTESGSDYLEIHDGPDSSAARIGRYSGTGPPDGDVISSTTNQLWFRFRSDSSYNYSGFKLDYEAV
ncbi:CUB and sushi domain-containing protein 3-like isoform X2 [Branchiostoma floridae x Branchiostoma belcheri]